MKYTFEKGEKSTVKVTVTLTAKEWATMQDQAYEKTKGKYQIPGFRKGHVPKSVIEQTYGKGAFYEEAVNLAFSKYYYDVLEKEPTIEPIDRPDVEIDKLDAKGLTFSAVVPVKPEVKLGEYKGIKIDKVEYNVKDDDVASEVNRLLEQHATEENVEGRAAKNGDITVIDYSGAIDGVKFAGGTAEKQNLTLGSGTFIPGFEEQVEGMNVGETKDITVKFPDDYGAEDLKGKEAVFTVTLHEIKEKKLPELTDEFVKEKTGNETVEAYKASIKEKLEKANEKSKISLYRRSPIRAKSKFPTVLSKEKSTTWYSRLLTDLCIRVLNSKIILNIPTRPWTLTERVLKIPLRNTSKLSSLSISF